MQEKTKGLNAVQNQQYTNDLSLLRPFNLEAAKSGEEICWYYLSDPVKFIGITSKGAIAYESEDEIGFTSSDQFRMKPLCWVEGKPAYNGDVLYWNDSTGAPGTTFNVVGPMVCEGKLICGDAHFKDGRVFLGEGNSGVTPSELTWNKPKQKVKRKVWINVYPNEVYGNAHTSPEAADDLGRGRIACVETEIEYEV